MPVNKDERITKKKNGLFRYRVRVNYIDANGNSQQIERLVWGKAEAEAMEQNLIAEYKDKHLTARPTAFKNLDKVIILKYYTFGKKLMKKTLFRNSC